MSELLSAAPTYLDRLAGQGIDVETGARRLAEYSYDASNYRIKPSAVIFPRTPDDVVAVARECHAAGVPIVCRGGGTSMAGNAVGSGVVLEFSRHMNRVDDIDADALRARVQPGMVISALADAASAATGGALTFAPDPSSRTRATLGGAIANDACGNHSVRYGRTTDHVIALDLVTADGVRLTAERTGVRATDPGDGRAAARAAELTEQLTALRDENLADFRVELGRIQRQVSGYHLDHLLPEHGFDVARALVGTEGTCAIVVGATVRLVRSPAESKLFCLGYDDIVEAARDVELLREFDPSAIEGIDEAIVKTMRQLVGEDSVTGLPAGHAWLYVVLDGDDAARIDETGRAMMDRLEAAGHMREGLTIEDTGQRAQLWRVRTEGAGYAAHLYTGHEGWPGWEDTAVAPEKLADYLTDFRELLAEFNMPCVMYGHFGAGCMHTRLAFELRTDAGRLRMREFMEAAARLVVHHGGSLSGEHGDGRARSELLPIMYSSRLRAAFADFKRIWDPAGLLNPGTIVDPDSLDDNLALAGVPEREWRTSFHLEEMTHGHRVDPFVRAAQSCVGIGKCRTTSGGVMCPSYRATRDEKDSTRGRARVLQDMVRGASTPEEGWKSDEVRDVLDLCLSCKACSTDCPAGVDMATYKSEFFDHYYSGRVRPLSHYSLGWLPTWLKLAGKVAPLVNAVLATPAAKVAARAGGLTDKRRMPKFASSAALRRALGKSALGKSATNRHADTVLVIDSFTKGFRPHVAESARRVLGSAGRTVECNADACCGLTWISTGQLDKAKAQMRRAVKTLDDGTDRPVVVPEPSCAAAFKKDMPELVQTDASRRVAGRVRSFAAYVGELADGGFTPEWREGRAPEAVTVQTHCHEYSVFGAKTQERTLKSIGVGAVREATGCCGVAGNFGFEKEHFDVSVQVAEQALAPALRETGRQTPVLTDGFSCLMQVDYLEPNRVPLHLAELIDERTTDSGRRN
ncbi:FAD-binding and (Fe-S)-binding domain-containing protein [Spelaeicoccus albus]|uniref:FAD/FMN-containing dehydrogenase/Fe-S oxidoreductase n=1 Tax=Spelaeicoccus albus TaxID=1280376 RepID=A0A7Z0AAI8_9MICO|nr:FAD-binding and (Fe-S)-binding domain-containing protein [Spelaeicoccus albus]NYI66631.1 FAD/FMN-containing dehydrogenase/Fe-S oxidoreductase [Spelaeicoccus albus]